MATPPEADDLSFLKEIGDLPVDPASATPPSLPPTFVAGWHAGAPLLTRAQLRQRRLQALGLAVAWLAGHFLVYGARQNLDQLPGHYVALQIALPFLLGISSLLVALAGGKWGLGLALGGVAALALLGPALFVLLALGVAPPLEVAPGATWSSHLVCLDLTLVWMSVPLLLAALNLRRAFPSAAGWRSALVGAACGLFAGAMMNLHCSSVLPLHLLLGHALPVVCGGLIGGLLLVRWLRV